MARERWLWDSLVRPDLPAAWVGYDRREIQFPLNVERTLLADSRDYAQLQLADLLAGATATFCRSVIQTQPRSNYVDRLEEAGIQEFGLGGIWPSPDITPEDLGSMGENLESHIDFISDILRRR